MKRSTLTFFLSMAAAVGLVSSASADLLYTFDTGIGVSDASPESGGIITGKAVWDSTVQGVRHNITGPNQGGWTLGGTDNMRMEFNYPVQTTIASMDLPTSILSFDLILDDDTWGYIGTGGWGVQFNIAGNSAGTVGYTQVGLTGPFSLYQNGVYHYDFTFAQLGWGEGGVADNYFQVFFGANSASTDGIGFVIDNISVTPEPSTIALAGLGVAALLGLRRRS
jgi:hypothetical protein